MSVASSMSTIVHPTMPPRFLVRRIINPFTGRGRWTIDSQTGMSSSGGYGDNDPFTHALEKAVKESTARRARWYAEMQARGKGVTS